MRSALPLVATLLVLVPRAVTAQATVSVQVDYTYRRLAVDGGSYLLPSVTLGLVLRH